MTVPGKYEKMQNSIERWHATKMTSKKNFKQNTNKLSHMISDLDNENGEAPP